MVKRYMKTIFGIILYVLFFSLALLPILVIRPHIENSQYAIAVTVWAIGTALFFIPALSIIIRRTWFFAGSGEPVSQAVLQHLLSEINELDAPVQVKKQRKKMIVSWRFQDQSWSELLEKKRLKKLYELWLRFDNSTKTVIMSDRYRSVDWTFSPFKVKTGWFSFSKPYFKVATGLNWGVENYVDSSPDDYSFMPNEIKSPILNTILKNGWNVRFSLF